VFVLLLPWDQAFSSHDAFSLGDVFTQVSRLADENRELEQTIRHMIEDIESRTVSCVFSLRITHSLWYFGVQLI